MAKPPVKKTTYVKGSKGSNPTPLTIPSKPVNFEISQNMGLFPAKKK